MKKLIFILGTCFIANSSLSQAIYSRSELKKMELVADKRTCLKFEATFSTPLSEIPTAMVDVDLQNTFDKILHKALEVISVTKTKFQMMVKDRALCKKLQHSPSNVEVSILGARGIDGHQVIPAGKIFSISN